MSRIKVRDTLNPCSCYYGRLQSTLYYVVGGYACRENTSRYLTIRVGSRHLVVRKPRKRTSLRRGRVMCEPRANHMQGCACLLVMAHVCIPSFDARLSMGSSYQPGFCCCRFDRPGLDTEKHCHQSDYFRSFPTRKSAVVMRMLQLRL